MAGRLFGEDDDVDDDEADIGPRLFGRPSNDRAKKDTVASALASEEEGEEEEAASSLAVVVVVVVLVGTTFWGSNGNGRPEMMDAHA